MTHNEMVHGLCTQETITVQNFAELIRFTLDANEEVIYDGWINVYVPIWFDADKAFGLDLNSEEDCDGIVKERTLALNISLRYTLYDGGYNFATLLYAVYSDVNGWTIQMEKE